MTRLDVAVIVLQSISATCAWACGLFMLRFWRGTGDRLFLFFAIAFWLLGVSWIALATFDPGDESRPYAYALRMLAFTLIIVATVDKNRVRRR